MRIDVSRSIRAQVRRAATVILLNVLLTVTTAAIVGPAASKLDAQFGMIGWVARLPFYALLAYIGPAVLWMRPSLQGGAVVGFLLATPLSLWSAATHCPPAVIVAYLMSGLAQGVFLALVVRESRSSDREAAV